MGVRFSGGFDVDCVESDGRWAAMVRGTGFPTTSGHPEPAGLVFSTLDLLAAHTSMRPSSLRLHSAGGRLITAAFPPGRSEQRTRTEDGTDWSDTWTATLDPTTPGAVWISARGQAMTPRRVTHPTA